MLTVGQSFSGEVNESIVRFVRLCEISDKVNKAIAYEISPLALPVDG